MGAAPDQCAFVGDSDVDMQTAKAAGMYAVGVLWGFREADELRNAGADALIGSMAELPAYLDR
ncbi:MAG TPA: HAD hydrolase-like protein [Spirochaetales bacterium]|nr:HAD hydrolase-like protein [Spirochaetales bacterium]